MKRLLFLLLLLPFLAQAKTAGQGCKFEWDWEGDRESIDGFRLYSADQKIWQGTEQIVPCDGVMPPLTDGWHTITARAYNAIGESGDSNELTFYYVRDIPAAPTLRLIIAPVE